MNPAIAQTLPILSLVVAGFLLKQSGLFREGDGGVLARVIINTTLPAVIFLSVSRAAVPPARLLVLALCGMAIPLLMRWVSGSLSLRMRWPRRIAGVVILGTMATNIGFFLLPLFSTIYGSDGTSRVAAFDIGNSLIANSVGLYVATCYGDLHMGGVAQSVRRVVSSPILFAGLSGLAFNLSGLQLPSAVVKVLETVGAANTPLAMLTLGSFLQVRYGNWSPILATVALRMGLGFVAGQALLAIFQLRGIERATVALGAAMPVGLVTLVYSVSEGMDAEIAAGVISLSIVVAILITPLLLTLF
ncbi:MAG TPA: AEC family transporter [Anaerolineae bacterium]